MKYVIGADIGGTTVKLGLFQADGVLLEKWEIPTVIADAGGAVLRDVAAAVDGCLNRHDIARADLLGIGAGIPGPVLADGTVNRCVNLGWGVFNVSRALSEITGLPVESANDANVAALGEYWMGGGKGYRDMIFVTLGTGVGGAVIADGKLIPGAHGAGGELGHMVINKDEPEQCACGRYGCVQQYVSATGIVRLAKLYLASHPETESALRNVEKLTAKAIFDCAAAGDAAAKAALEDVYDAFGYFLAASCTVSDPEVVVIGGGVSKAGAPLLEGARRAFEKYAFYPNKGIAFALAALGNDAGIYGCCKLILDRFPQA
ncbi:MAG: ROK family glucokinase [Ruminococcus bromii]|nr:ROK family glucokinase [Ruminococcus bromii]